MKRALAALVALLLLAGAAALSANASNPSTEKVTAPPSSGLGPSPSGPIVQRAVKMDVSAPLRSIPPRLTRAEGPREIAGERLIQERHVKQVRQVVDPVVQTIVGPFAMPTPIQNFEGIFNYWGFYPPDPTGEIGSHHYINMVNNGFQIYDRNGVTLYGPVDNNILWSGFGGLCEIDNAGDPVVQYDQLADRWVLMQFTAVYGGVGGNDFLCYAVSSTPDPLGTWNRYAFESVLHRFPDYPKFTVWPDAYYMTTREFAPGYSGLGAYALERDAMLAGDPGARSIYFHLAPSEVVQDRWLPSDLDGTPPPPGTPNYFAVTSSAATGGPQDEIVIREFHTDWVSPTLSTFNTVANIVTAPYNPVVCPGGLCVEQPGTPQKLDTLTGGGEGILYRLVYRNFGDHEALLMQQTVNGGGDRAGIRWWEVRDPGAGATLYQQGTFAPADTLHRWMGSIAFDRMGNIALGYSVANTTTFPSIMYTGRLVTDTLGTLPQGETLLYAGTGSQTGTAGRWGDYTHLSLDPLDDCTFWYTNEYVVNTSGVGWKTRVGSFRFPNCVAAPAATPTSTGTATATVTPCAMNFSDVQPTDWFYEFVNCLFCKGAISGYDDGTFRPYNNTTRGQMTKIVVIAFDYEIYTPPTPTFTDVPPDHPFYDVIETAAYNNIVAGYDDGTFRPFNNVTRGQLSKIVVIAAGWATINPPEPTFDDVPSDHPFYTYIETAACHQIISGYDDGTFRPYNDATRAQIAKIVCLAMRDDNPCPTVSPTPTPLLSATPTPQPTLCPGGVALTGSITLSDPTQTGRVNWDFDPSSCQTAVQSCTVAGTVQRHYDSYTYTNSTGSAQCIRVDLDATGCETSGVFSAAYLGSFNPATVCANYLADAGSLGPQKSYSFTAAAGATYVIVVHEIADNAGCASYSLRVSPCAGLPTFTATATSTPAPPTFTNTPTATPQCQGVTYTIATSTATMLPATNDVGNHGDDVSTLIDLPFPITVYTTTYNQAYVGSNGHIQFQSRYESFYDPQCVPVEVDPPFLDTIFAYYDDLLTIPTTTEPCTTCGIYTATLGTTPNRQFVIRWETTYFNHAGTANFEVLLTEGSNTISVIYGPNNNNGLEASTGIQHDLLQYTAYSCNQPMLMPGVRVDYVLTGCDYNRRY